MTDLRKKKCTPCEGGIPPMTLEEALAMGKEDYEVMAFVNAIAWISHREDHHPSLTVGYSRCEAVYSTHAVEGLTENDFICAAKIDALLE
jgi:4a-hydroxytetrahydrobiopterin dehydratase